jgi:putative oxidoreductase
MDAGFLIARLILGLAISAHGAQKLFGWFGGHSLKGTGTFFESLGFRPGSVFALAAGLCELGGGLLTTAGLLGPVGPALIVLVMLVAILAVHWPHGFFASSNGMELPLMYLTAALFAAFAGPGVYSVDGLLGLDTRPEPMTAWAAIAVAVPMALVNVALRRSPHAPARTHA